MHVNHPGCHVLHFYTGGIRGVPVRHKKAPTRGLDCQGCHGDATSGCTVCIQGCSAVLCNLPDYVVDDTRLSQQREPETVRGTESLRTLRWLPLTKVEQRGPTDPLPSASTSKRLARDRLLPALLGKGGTAPETKIVIKN